VGNNFNCRHGPTCVAGVVADEHILASREWNKERKEENILNSIILPQSAIKKCDEIMRAYVWPVLYRAWPSKLGALFLHKATSIVHSLTITMIAGKMRRPLGHGLHSKTFELNLHNIYRKHI
jgi:hypothetical protein